VGHLVLTDPRLGEVGLELVHPGDSARVLRALDAVEPLYKVAGPGCAFPGFLGPPDMAGRGRDSPAGRALGGGRAGVSVARVRGGRL
jgi:Glycine/sarcosine/betaine reductase component B subunits